MSGLVELLDLVKLVVKWLGVVFNWLDNMIKSISVPLLESIGISEPASHTIVTILELLLILTLIVKVAGILRWILLLFLLLLLLGMFYPALGL